jgi:hypothetical protein
LNYIRRQPLIRGDASFFDSKPDSDQYGAVEPQNL